MVNKAPLSIISESFITLYCQRHSRLDKELLTVNPKANPGPRAHARKDLKAEPQQQNPAQCPSGVAKVNPRMEAPASRAQRSHSS